MAGAPPSPTLPPSGAAGKKKPGDERKAQRGKFRETMWFQKGDLDAAAAEAAAEERAQGKDVDLDRADSLPIEERDTDDGSTHSTPAQRYSPKPGSTQVRPANRGAAGASGKVSEDELIDEMKGGRAKLIMVIAVVVVLLIVAVLAFAL